MPHHKPRLGVWKFASCDGCQLSLLDCEDELLAIAGALEIAYFPEATRGEVKGVYDLEMVSGGGVVTAILKGDIAVLSRGGSDLTGGEVAYAVKADLYENWTEHFTLCPVLTIQGDDLDYVAHPEHLEIIVEKVKEKLMGKDEVVFTQ